MVLLYVGSTTNSEAIAPCSRRWLYFNSRKFNQQRSRSQCCKQGELHCIRMFLLHFCINVQNQQTPLHVAAQNGHTSMVESLIKCGADVNAVDKVIIIVILYCFVPSYMHIESKYFAAYCHTK